LTLAIDEAQYLRMLGSGPVPLPRRARAERFRSPGI